MRAIQVLDYIVKSAFGGPVGKPPVPPTRPPGPVGKRPVLPGKGKSTPGGGLNADEDSGGAAWDDESGGASWGAKNDVGANTSAAVPQRGKFISQLDAYAGGSASNPTVGKNPVYGNKLTSGFYQRPTGKPQANTANATNEDGFAGSLYRYGGANPSARNPRQMPLIPERANAGWYSSIGPSGTMRASAPAPSVNDVAAGYRTIPPSKPKG